MADYRVGQFWRYHLQLLFLAGVARSYGHFGPWTLRHQDISALVHGHLGTVATLPRSTYSRTPLRQSARRSHLRSGQLKAEALIDNNYTRNHTSELRQIFYMHAAFGRGAVLFLWRCNPTSGFADDVILFHSGPAVRHAANCYTLWLLLS